MLIYRGISADGQPPKQAKRLFFFQDKYYSEHVLEQKSDRS